MEELRSLLNRHSRENGSNTPDFILATFLEQVLIDWDHAVRARDQWYGRNHDVAGLDHALQVAEDAEEDGRV
jgi:hypothetical protein